MFRNPFREWDQEKLKRSSDVLQTQTNYLKIVNHRILLLGAVIITVFVIVAARLFYLQISEHENYKIKLENYSSQEQRTLVARGAMYDRNGKTVVESASSLNITYFPPEGTTSEDKWKLAKQFVKTFHIKDSKLNLSDYQDLYLFLYRDENGFQSDGTHLLSEDELLSIETAAQKDALIRSKITKEMAQKVASKEDENAYVIYQAMNKLPASQMKVIIEDADNKDVAYLMEHKDQFRGFDVDFGSWKREYPYGDTLRDVLGRVSTTKQGVPFEEREYFTAKGYSISDRVGISGLEKQYEQLLSGTPRIQEVNYGNDGIAVLDEISSGKKGYDLHLTIDIDLQQKVDKILADTLKRYGETSGREAFNQCFMLLMNPKTGEIYSINGAMLNEDKSITKFASGVYLNSYQVGSVAKGATVYMMLNEGIQSANTVEDDSPMNIAGLKKSSYRNYGLVNGREALAVSSNVYMWKSVIKLAGGTYQYGKSLNISIDKAEETLKLMRNYYSSFGLGLKTGLDVPNEALGVSSNIKEVGNLLDYSIGQFETYSPIQLGQYVSAIANGGYRVQPKLVNYATEINSDYRIYENKTKILSSIRGDSKHLEEVVNGFRDCVTENHCGVALNTMDKGVAAKTGTAQVYIVGEKEGHYTNTSEIGFAPYDDPEVAFVCSAPTSSADTHNLEANICSTIIVPEALNAYFGTKTNQKEK